MGAVNHDGVERRALLRHVEQIGDVFCFLRMIDVDGHGHGRSASQLQEAAKEGCAALLAHGRGEDLDDDRAALGLRSLDERVGHAPVVDDLAKKGEPDGDFPPRSAPWK
jgi:hypothetical protein